ncbi:MAG: hypothetical protein ACFFDO_09010 [Candidatus Thorarchaeota archaeon]
MINNRDREQKEIEAIQLIDEAENLVDKGKGEKALKLYEKAAQIYLDFGSYIKLDELYIQIAKIISRFKNNIHAIDRLNLIIRKTEQLKLYEISAKLLMRLANILYKMNDWESAGESWEKASFYLYKADPEEFHKLSSFLLLKAGQTYERSSLTKDKGKRLILQAVMKINKFDELYELEEKRAHNLLVMKEYEAAANKFYDIATYFRKSLDNLGEILDEEQSKDTMLNAKARFIHFVAEYQTVAAICLRVSENRAYNEKIKEIGNDSIQLFKESISLLKTYLFFKKAEFDKEVIMRITFDTMLLSFIQKILGVEKINPIELLLEESEKHKLLVKKLKETPYFKIAERIETIGLRESLIDLSKVHLGHFEEIKNTLLTYFLET